MKVSRKPLPCGIGVVRFTRFAEYDAWEGSLGFRSVSCVGSHISLWFELVPTCQFTGLGTCSLGLVMQQPAITEEYIPVVVRTFQSEESSLFLLVVLFCFVFGLCFVSLRFECLLAFNDDLVDLFIPV